MRMTHEADYALRIVYTLARHNKQLSAKTLSEETGVTIRFTLKILRRLSEYKIVAANKGATGGYYLTADISELSLGHIIECIDGPLKLNHCLSDDFDCTRVADKKCCPFHCLLGDISDDLRTRLYSAKIADFINK
ncbi:MAG: Rrf2 family transcriptional regulator [Clostridia bacterium]|nr:Rrf2 family transcriptional regulator [Clostridia bacterium]